MPSTGNLIAFSLFALGLVLTPGPNMMYLVSRSVCQGRDAGLVSLGGVALAFLLYMIFAAVGLTALLLTVPFAYDGIRIGGAMYLAWLCWQALRPGGRSPFQVRDLSPDGPARLFAMGFLTNLLNPKAAVMYLSILPQFIEPRSDRILLQLLVLGISQITISVVVNSLIVIAAGTISHALQTRPSWSLVQRWLMGAVLGGLAIKLAIEPLR